MRRLDSKVRFAVVLCMVLAVSAWPEASAASASCCQGTVGDVDGSGGNTPTVADIGRLVDYLFITGTPLDCMAEADVNQSGGINPDRNDITVADISAIVFHLFVIDVPLKPCLEAAQGELIWASDCKTMETFSTDSVTFSMACIAWEYDGNGNLTLWHYNAGLNCCPEYTVEVVVGNGNIQIIETETSGNCACLCLFDFQMQVVGIEPGVWHVEVDEEYLSPSDEPLDDYIDLSQAGSGMFCVDRSVYPWDQFLK